jgi:hypothetical protein
MHAVGSAIEKATKRSSPGGSFQSLDRDDFGLNQSKIMTAIAINGLERDCQAEPVSTFPHPALNA